MKKKKLFVLMGALTLVLGLTQCKKPNLPASNVAEINQHVTITAGYSDANSGGGTSKLSMDTPTGSTISLKWDEGDVVNVYQIINGNEIKVSNEGLHMVDKPIDEGKKAEFKGELNGVNPDKELIFRVGNKPTDIIYRSQDGTFEYIKENMLCVEGTSEYHQDGKYNVTMGLPYAIMKLDLSEFARYKNPNEGSIKVSVVYYDTEDTIATVGGVTMNTHEHYLAIPTDNAVNAKDSKKEIYTFWGNFNLSDCKWALKRSTLYTNAEGGYFKVHRQFIDLGTSDGLLWAVFCLGASEEGEYGDFYAWGETEPYVTRDGVWCKFASHIPEGEREEGVNDFKVDYGFGAENYFYEDDFGEYNVEWKEVPYYTRNDSICLKETQDVATAKDSLWRMPTQSEGYKFNEGGTTTVIKYFEEEGGRGYYFVSSVKNSQHFPVDPGDIGFKIYTGHYMGNEFINEGAGFWTINTEEEIKTREAFPILLNGGASFSWIEPMDRYHGYQIRPVRKLKMKRD